VHDPEPMSDERHRVVTEPALAQRLPALCALGLCRGG
jgi:hypothetical protein